MTLRTHMWDQPELRQWLRFTPLVTFPTQDIGLPLLWARSQQDQHASITDYFENLVSCLQKRLTLEVRGHADYFLAFEELASGTAWLTSTQVSDWYHIIPFNEQKAFSKWTVNLHNSIQASLDKAGGLIMLSHLVPLSHSAHMQSSPLPKDRKLTCVGLSSLHGIRKWCSSGWYGSLPLFHRKHTPA